MANNITLTAAMRSNLLSLQRTQGLLDMTQLRLSTGRKVNSALDDANAFFASQSLSNRASDLSRLLDGMGQSIQVLKAADQGITSLTKLTEQAQAIAQSGRDTVSNSGLFRSGDVSAALQAALGAGAAGTLTLTSGSGQTAAIVVTAASTLAQVAAAINASAGFSAQIVDGTTGAAGTNKRLEIRATNGQTLTIAASATATFFNANQGGAGGSAGVNGATGGAYTIGGAIASTSNSVDQISLERQYNAIRTQIDQLITDTGYRGTNLLNGDNLTTQFNEKNTSTQTVTGVTFNAAGLAISAANFLNATNIQSALNEVTSALNTLRNQARTFGTSLTVIQTRQDYTQNLVNVLNEGSDKLTIADKNEEGANLLALQTSQQLGVTSLSLASQASQAVLRLFG